MVYFSTATKRRSRAASWSIIAPPFIANDFRKSVVLSLVEHAIVVRDDQGKTMFEVTLAFDDQAECRLHVNQDRCELWQVRRMALEELFFPRY